MHGRLRYRRRSTVRTAAAELYSSVLVVGIVVALSYFVFTQAPAPGHPSHALIVTDQYEILGNPSLFFFRLNASGEVTISEFRVDGASSLTGVLSLGQTGYGVSAGLCAPGLATFFSVFTPEAGELSVITNGQVWVDGITTDSASMSPGWHEIIISDGKSCTITLPDGVSVSSPSGSVSTIPLISTVNPNSYGSFIPYNTIGHSVAVVSEVGLETIGF